MLEEREMLEIQKVMERSKEKHWGRLLIYPDRSPVGHYELLMLECMIYREPLGIPKTPEVTLDLAFISETKL